MKEKKEEKEEMLSGTRTSKPSRRGFLGGALAVTLAAVLLPADRTVVAKKKWETGKTRWIGHW